MSRFRLMPNYRYYNAEGTSHVTLPNSVGKPLRDYKIYGNSIQEGTPSTDSPVEIQSVGEKTINLAPNFCSEYPTEKAMDVCKFPIKANTTYSIYFDTEKHAYRSVWLYDIDNNITKLVSYAYGLPIYNKMVVIPKQDGYMSVGILDSDAKVIVAEGMYFTLNTKQQNDLNNTGISLTVTSGELPYEPYNKYKIPVRVSGKNLLNLNRIGVSPSSLDADIVRDETSYIKRWAYWNAVDTRGSGTYEITDSGFTVNNGCGSIGFPMKIERGKTYTLSVQNCTISGDTKQYYLTATCYNANGEYIKNYIQGNDHINHLTVDTSSGVYQETEYIVWSVRRGANYNTMTVEGIQVEEGNTATSYEPYTSRIKHIYLDEQLYKYGEYIECIDFIAQTIFKHCKQWIFTGDEEWYLYTGKLNTFRTSLGGATIRSGTCSHYIKLSSGNQLDVDTGIYTSGTSSCVISDPNFNTVDEFKTFLKEQYNLGTPLTMIGLININPIEYSIKLPIIDTYKSSNVITIGTNVPPSNITVQYYK